MMKTPQDIQVVLFDGRPAPTPELAAWLMPFPFVTRASEIIGPRTDRRIDRYRNEVAAWFMQNTERPYLLMVDDDAVPVKETGEMFADEGWVLGADFISRKGVRAHFADGEIGFCMALIDRRVFRQLPPEPFSLAPGDDCECDAFCRRCREVGLWPRKVGKVAHALTLYVTPDGPGCKIKFPDAVAPTPHPTRPSVPTVVLADGSLFVAGQ